MTTREHRLTPAALRALPAAASDRNDDLDEAAGDSACGWWGALTATLSYIEGWMAGTSPTSNQDARR